MPKRINIRSKTKEAVKRYIEIRYSHWTEVERRIYRGKVERELERRKSFPKDYGDPEKEYCKKVDAFFARNQDFLDIHKKSSEEILLKQKKQKEFNLNVDKLFKLPEKDRIVLIRKCGGDINKAIELV